MMNSISDASTSITADSFLQIESPSPGPAPTASGDTVKKNVTIPRLRMASMPVPVMPRSPRLLKSPRQPVPTALPDTDQGMRNHEDSLSKTHDDSMATGHDGSQSKQRDEPRSTPADVPPLPSSLPAFRIRRFAITIPKELLKEKKSDDRVDTELADPNRSAIDLPLSSVASTSRTKNAGASTSEQEGGNIKSSAPANLSPGSLKAHQPTTSAAVQALEALIIRDAVTFAHTTGMPDHVDRAFAVAKLPPTLKHLVADRTCTCVPTSYLIGVLFGPAIEGSAVWTKVQAICQEILRNDSKRLCTDTDLLPDRLEHAKRMVGTWAERVASTLIGQLGTFDQASLPAEILDFLIDCDHHLHAALLDIHPALHSTEINKRRFTLLNRLLLERYLLPLVQKLKSKPPTRLEAWLSEAIRDALQQQLLVSGKDFFILSFKCIPDSLKEGVEKAITAEIRADEQLKIETRKQNLLERTRSSQRRDRKAHMRSASDNVTKFEALTRQKIRESEARRLLTDVLSTVHLQGLPDLLVKRISKEFRSFMPANSPASVADVLGYLEKTVDDYVDKNTLVTSEKDAVIRVKRQIAEWLASEQREKVERRASGVTGSFDQDFIDHVFQKGQGLDDLMGTVREVREDEDIVMPSPATPTTSSSALSSSSIASTSSVPTTTASTAPQNHTTMTSTRQAETANNS